MLNKYFNKIIFVFSLTCLFGTFTHLSATNKVYPLDTTYAIVADDTAWKCKMGKSHSLGYSKGIKGESTLVACTFDYFLRKIEAHNSSLDKVTMLERAKVLLSEYANKKSLILNEFFIEEFQGGDHYIVSGTYFGNQITGRFALYMKPLVGNEKKRVVDHTSYYMLVQVEDDTLDVQTVENLFQEAYDLIQPLINS